MKRKIYDELLTWKRKSGGRTAMLLEGARGTGKSYIAEAFARQEYRSFIIIDFENAPEVILDLFTNESYNLDFFFAKLSLFYSTRLYRRESLIIFKEVQQFPRARQLIKYLSADGRYDYLETGSRIRLWENVEKILIPSGEDNLVLYPMDFEEFLWAMEDETMIPWIRKAFEEKKPLGPLHSRIMDAFHVYMQVGGMPESVLAYCEGRDLNASREAQSRILDRYSRDITRYAAGYEEKVFAVLEEIPGELIRKGRKYRLSSISRDARFRSYKKSFIWLKESLVTNMSFQTSDPDEWPYLFPEGNGLRCYMGDTGLLAAHASETSISGRKDVFEGMLMENMAAQMLRRNGRQLYFYSRNDDRHRENHMEIDFLIRRNGEISPIEVKSGNYRALSSITKFRRKFPEITGTPCVLYPGDVARKDEIWYLPIYMAMCL